MNYWWLNANPDDPTSPWCWTKSKKVGEIEEWHAKGKKGKTKPYALKVKEGDLVFGFNSGSQKKLVALAYISKGKYVNEIGEDVFCVTKIKDLDKPIGIDDIKEIPLFKDKLSDEIKLRGTINPLTPEEFTLLLSII